MYLLSYFLATMGLLTKGLPSLAFQGITLLSFAVYFRQWKFLLSWQHFFGILFFIVLTTLYFFMYSTYNDPMAFIGRLLFESGRRASGQNADLYSYLKHFISFPITLLYLMVPGILFLPGIKKSVFRDKWVQFCLLFILPNLIVYLISPSTRVRYLFPFLPFLSVVMSLGFFGADQKVNKKISPFITAAVLIASFFLFGAYKEIEGAWLIIAVFVAIVAAVLFFQIYKNRIPLWGPIIILIALRLLFSLTTLEKRYRTDHKNSIAAEARKLSEELGENQLLFYTPEQNYSYSFLGKQVNLQEIDRLSYAFTYYFEIATEKILYSTSKLDRKGFYLIEEIHMNENNNIEVIRPVTISKGKYFLIQNK
jgi:hypothetical protein